MKSQWTIPSSLVLLAAGALAVVLVVPALALESGEPSPRQLKKLAKQADRALRDGRADQAAELYRQVLDATSPADDLRGRVLYKAALHRLESGDSGQVSPALEHLDELAEFYPRHPRRQEILVLRTLAATLVATSDLAEEARRELEERESALVAARQELAENRAQEVGQSEEAGVRIRSLESQLRTARAELAQTRSELAKKEEALERLLKIRAERDSG